MANLLDEELNRRRRSKNKSLDGERVKKKPRAFEVCFKSPTVQKRGDFRAMYDEDNELFLDTSTSSLREGGTHTIHSDRGVRNWLFAF